MRDREKFRFRPTTALILLASASLAVPVAIGWGAHDGGWPAILITVFPFATIASFVLSVIRLKNRWKSSIQAWVEVGASSILLALFVHVFMVSLW